MPAAAQLKPLLDTPEGGEMADAGVEEEEEAAARGSSQTVHFLAESGLLHEHVEQVHSPAFGAAGAFIPAAAQLNPELEEDAETGAEDNADVAGRGSSQIVHFFALSGDLQAHIEQVHSPPLGAVGVFNPAADQSKLVPFVIDLSLDAELGIGAKRLKVGRLVMGRACTAAFAWESSASERVASVEGDEDDEVI